MKKLSSPIFGTAILSSIVTFASVFLPLGENHFLTTMVSGQFSFLLIALYYIDSNIRNQNKP